MATNSSPKKKIELEIFEYLEIWYNKQDVTVL